MSQNLVKNIFRLLLKQEQLDFYHNLNWEEASKTFTNSAINYPLYYTQVQFHGIEKGYLTPVAAITYDLVTKLATFPSERKLRQGIIEAVEKPPEKMLELGCGTGSTILSLKKKFREAEAIALDLSPYMLIIADFKAKQQGVKIKWLHGLAEATGLENNSFDLISISMVFHETPVKIAQLILQESFNLLKPGGQIIILDAQQEKLINLKWLSELFREPYSQVYAAENLDNWLINTGFKLKKKVNLGLIYQISSAIKS
jgi:ubiquinone/menaquinone biosynthesis C-methylase UbiE